jgi:3-oxoacyl-[acyl-carrier-protein] synthase III
MDCGKDRDFRKKVWQKHMETTSSMGAKAALKAIENAGISKNDVDFIIFATLSPDYYFPGCGVSAPAGT